MSFNFDKLTELEKDSLFRLKYQPSRPFEWDPNSVAVLGIEHCPNHIIVGRVNVTILDVLSDIGGLVEVLFFIIGAFVYVVNYEHLNNHLAAKLYKL